MRLPNASPSPARKHHVILLAESGTNRARHRNDGRECQSTAESSVADNPHRRSPQPTFRPRSDRAVHAAGFLQNSCAFPHPICVHFAFELRERSIQNPRRRVSSISSMTSLTNSNLTQAQPFCYYSSSRGTHAKYSHERTSTRTFRGDSESPRRR